MRAARLLLLAALTVAGLAGAVLLWRALTQSTHPRGLLKIALTEYDDASSLEPFVPQVGTRNGDRHERLFEISDTPARKLLSDCPIDSWKHVGALRAPADGDAIDGERLFHLWECDSRDGKVMAAELWKPHMGASGVYFAACSPNKCPSYPQAFPEIRDWLGGTFEPVADRPAQ